MLSQEELSGFELQLKSLESTLAQGPDKHSTRHYQYVQALLGPARSIYLYLNGQPDEALVEAEHAITAAPADLPLARCLALVGLAYACAEKGEPLKALPLAEEAIALSQQVRQTHLLVLMIALKARLLLGRGKLREAEQVLVNSFSDVLHLEFVKSSNVVHMIAQLAALHYRRNELDKALEQSQKCIRYATLQQANESLLESYTVAALTLQAQGKARQASDMMEEARIIGAATAAPLRERGVELAAIELALLQGELDSVTAWADARALSANQPYSDSWEQSALLKAKFLLHRGEFEQAANIAELLKPRAEKRQRYGACLKADLVHVSALQALGQEEPARKILERAVECFAPEGYVRPFVEHAEYLQDLLLSLRNSRTEAVRQYLPTLLQACQAALEPASRSRRIELEHGVELTPREAEILQFIATGMSNKEIGATAFVSLSTVKTHINHIFQKLDVGNRKDMIRKARELEIISG
jgi:LuxR family maltose regulon positive regulatory protein